MKASTKGLSIIELIVAMAVLAIIIVFASSSVSNAFVINRKQVASSSAQAKLRRVQQVFSQEFRHAVLGGIALKPYDASPQSVSYVALDTGRWYQVLASSSNDITINAVMPQNDISLEGKQALLLNNSGQANILNISSLNDLGDYRFQAFHSGCLHPITVGYNSVLLEASSVGLRYDPISKTLYQNKAGIEWPLAFDISDFRIDYVYERLSDNEPTVLTEPVRDVYGLPQRSAVIGGADNELRRLQLYVAIQEKTNKDKSITRSSLSQVELSKNLNTNSSLLQSIQGVFPCD